ncbi:MAG: adenylate/guanylate cyclase domain-containing protein [Verrucomicrobiota bacterium]
MNFFDWKKNLGPALKQNWRGLLIGTLLSTGLGLFLFFSAFGKGLVHLSYDLPFAFRPNLKPTEAVMVYLDEASHSALEQPYNKPWSRAMHARLLDRLKIENARAVVFDIVFSDPGPDAAIDEQFAQAIKNNGKVILAADCVPAAPGISSVSAKQYVPPIELLGSEAADYGSAEMNPDGDLVIRQHIQITSDDQIFPISWATASFVGATVATNSKAQLATRWINYYGPHGVIPGVSFYKVVSPGENDLPRGFFSNKVVFVGARLLTKFSGDRKDEFPTPYSRFGSDANRFMPGVDIQATAFLNLLRGDWLRRFPDFSEQIVIAFAGIIFGISLTLCRPTKAVVVAFGAIFLIGAVNYFLFAHQQIWFPWLIVVAQTSIALLWSILFNSIQLYVQKKLAEQTLALYLSPKLVKKYSQQKFSGDTNLLKPGAEKQMLTILFSDIAGFTTISEGMDSDELAKLMNKYFETAVSQCVHKTDGTVVKYIGDAIFAFWNAPELQIDHAMRACEAAIRFQDQAVQYINNQALVTRIGLHTGVANVGNFGSTTRIDYTAIGENINLASRMEGLNKYLGTEILITGETEAGVRDRLTLRYLGLFQLKGFEKSVEVHQLMGGLEKSEATKALREMFGRALQSFREKNFDVAESGFRSVMELYPKDGPSKFYLHQIEELRSETLPADWKGEVELKDK